MSNSLNKEFLRIMHKNRIQSNNTIDYFGEMLKQNIITKFSHTNTLTSYNNCLESKRIRLANITNPLMKEKDEECNELFN